MEDRNKSATQSNLYVTIYNQDLEYISRCILDYPDCETGGDLFGFWNNRGLPVILYVSGPGDNCYRDSGFFRQDMDFLVGNGNHLFENYGLQHIGSWHSHHKLSLAVPSLHDSNTMVNAIRNSNIERFFMVLGNITKQEGTTINGFLYDCKTQTNYSETVWRVLNSENVLSKKIRTSLRKELYYQPTTTKPRLQDIRHLTSVANTNTVSFAPNSWLASEKGNQELKIVFDWFQSNFQDAKMLLHPDQTFELIGDAISISFTPDFPNCFPRIVVDGNSLMQDEEKFEYETGVDIIEFLKYQIDNLNDTFIS